ncbi:hypothetical protein DMB66_15910 [Actinoplanes sp. ATCC 53533]|uniref:RICIN domain-containing protein n=1 Tax=Actinoplanes sp. ATCC 53533 TaxID=1288362 RepID=UPI000F782F71|nr:RICIN domain-containing protein [Actinoplanes sp. ATCC 53533]RSM67439.1 hypothetical protein DMB66_15910 [Actinoplanes sp. ATCC 53533]
MTRTIARVIALVAVALTATLAAATPAQAATIRQIKTVKDGTCVRPTTKPTDLRARSCSTKPIKARDWQVIAVGKLNGHPVWQLKNRNTGKCLARSGTTGLGVPSSQSCGLGASTYWEVFTIKNGSKTTAIVLKSFSAFAWAGRHACLRYEGKYHAANVELATCNVRQTLQRWRP